MGAFYPSFSVSNPKNLRGKSKSIPREDEDLRKTIDSLTEFINDINKRRSELMEVLNNLKTKKTSSSSLRPHN